MKSRAKYMSDYMLNRYYERREYWLEELGGKCVVCGTTEDLEFDHIDASQKEFDIGRNLNGGSEERIKSEMAKCQLLCIDHHIEKSFREGDLPSVGHGEGLTGKRNCYCDLCKPLKAQYLIDKGYRVPAKKVPYSCGERRTYLKGCRCDLCKAANTEYSRRLKTK